MMAKSTRGTGCEATVYLSAAPGYRSGDLRLLHCLAFSEAPADKSPQPQFLQSQQKAETSVPDALPAPGESIEDPPTPPQSQFSANVITVEIK
jgi:hypothetical protein